uniref:DDB1- and CUL4-associated factor 15 isoform X2 n=1 Tax=Pristiophorus japonicus TaxID=55135 RepID=UPI00398E97B9
MAPGWSKRPGGGGRRRSSVLKSLHRLKITGQFSHRMFQNLPPILCVPLKNIVDDDFLLAGHIFLGFTKCGRYVLSYTRDVPEQEFDELPYYVYYLYWWKFNIHDKLKKVRQVHLFKDQEVYSDLYLTVCEWPSDPSKLIVFGFNIRSVNDLLINMVMSDENDRDIYITTVATPPFTFCPDCKDVALLSTEEQNAHCLQHGFMLHTKYQVVYPFPTFQPAFQLKKDGVVLLNTSYSLVACAISVNTTGEKGQILYSKSSENSDPPGPLEADPSLTSPVTDGYPQCEGTSRPLSGNGTSDCIFHGADADSCSRTDGCCEETLSWEPRGSKHAALAECSPAHCDPSSAAGKAKEFAADIFRRARAATGTTEAPCSVSQAAAKQKEGAPVEDCRKLLSTQRGEGSESTPSSSSSAAAAAKLPTQCSSCVADPSGSALSPKHSNSLVSGCTCTSPGKPALDNGVSFAARPRTEAVSGFAQSESAAMDNTAGPLQEPAQTEPGYVNYIKLHYVLEPSGMVVEDDGYDDKISLPFVVTDLRGRNLKPFKETASYQGKYLTVEQLTLDFEYVINEVIRNDASWSPRYCSFSDYDIVILEVCPITNHVIINIGLLLLAYPSDEEGQVRPKTYHTCLKGAWNLNTGIFATVGVGDLTAVQGQTSGSVWSTFRKSCVDVAMRWLVPESTFRNVNRMTNEALHKGRSLKRLADSGRSMWIVL